MLPRWPLHRSSLIRATCTERRPVSCPSAGPRRFSTPIYTVHKVRLISIQLFLSSIYRKKTFRLYLAIRRPNFVENVVYIFVFYKSYLCTSSFARSSAFLFPGRLYGFGAWSIHGNARVALLVLRLKAHDEWFDRNWLHLQLRTSQVLAKCSLKCVS